MDIGERREGAVTVIRPVGPLCLGDAEQFRRYCSEVLTRSLGRFVVDASAIPYVDSLGLEALADVADELAQGGQTLRLCGATETVREALELTELAPMFEQFEDTGAAVRSFL